MKSLLPILIFVLIASCGPVSNSSVVSQQTGDNGEDPALTTNDEILKSQMNRAQGSMVYSQFEIREKTKALKEAYLPEGHSVSPTLENLESVVTKIDHSEYLKDCGIISLSETTIADRISDCDKVYLAKLGKKTTWASQLYGVAGEGNWRLVSVSISGESKKMIWYDLTTKLLWTDYLGDVNFEKAAIALGKVCEEFQDSNEYSLDSNFVTWRLPTRSDFLQADINGARYVLNNIDKEYWTATQKTLTTAWAINQKTGNSSSTELTELRSVRCVGIPLQ